MAKLLAFAAISLCVLTNLALVVVMVITRSDLRCPTPVIPLWNANDFRLTIAIDGWSIGVYSIREFSAAEYKFAIARALLVPSRGLTRESCLGFVFRGGEYGFGDARGLSSAFHETEIGVPAVPVFALTLVGLPWWWSRWRREILRHPDATTECASCGYDLRATPDRCPECGSIVDPIH